MSKQCVSDNLNAPIHKVHAKTPSSEDRWCNERHTRQQQRNHINWNILS